MSQSVKHLLFLILFVCLAVYFLYRPATKAPSDSEVVVAQKQKRPAPPKEKPSFQRPTETTPISEKRHKKGRPQTKKKMRTSSTTIHPISAVDLNLRKLPKGTVAFKVVKGEAIAHGDIILGKVHGEFNANEGIFKPEHPPKLWPEGVVPFVIQSDLPDPQRVLNVIEYFNSTTNIEFVPYDGEDNALVFTPSEELCASYLGMVGGAQPIRLSPGCGFTEITHEIMHALGFVHEQSRLDRDSFVEILWDNIKEPFLSQFDISPDLFTHFYREADHRGGFEFDFNSVMLYDPRFFAKPGQVTMRSLEGQIFAPKRGGLSDLDRERINTLYAF